MDCQMFSNQGVILFNNDILDVLFLYLITCELYLEFTIQLVSIGIILAVVLV